MKKLLSFCLCAVLLLGLCVPAFAADSGRVNYCGVEIVVDGATIVPKDANGKPVEPFIYNGSTYLPVRSVANALGLDVAWESGMVKLTSGAERTAAIGEPTMSFCEVTIPMGGRDTRVMLDGEVLDLKDAAGNPVSPIISDGTTYLPVRAVADALEVPVYWDGDNAIVYLGKRIEWLKTKETYTSKSSGNGYTSTYTYDADGNLLTETTVHPGYTSKRTCTYDARGNMLSRVYKDNDTEYPMGYSYFYTYDAHDNLLTERYVDEIDPEENYTFTYTYDARGNVLAETRDYADGYSRTLTYTYDANDNVLTEQSVNHKQPDYSYTSVYTYDAQGNLLTDRTDYADGDYYYSTYAYDADGNETYEKIETGSYLYTTTYAYNADGQLISVIEEDTYEDGTYRTETLYTYNGNSLTCRTITDEGSQVETYLYDDFDNLLEYTYVSGSSRSRTVYTYDDGNNTLRTEITYSDGTSSLTTYRYDAYGNKVEQVSTYGTTRYEYTAREW